MTAELAQEPEYVDLEPQEGPQTTFMTTSADIAIYGGAAGGGKTFGLLLEPSRHFDNEQFGGVIFRISTTQIRSKGGLWDESRKMYKLLNGYPRESRLEWLFPSGSTMKFAHLEYDSTVYDYQGAQIPYLGFDELTHFTEFQFFYMLSRNRSTSGIPGYIRATCNPDVNSWVRQLIDWWIDSKTGFAIPERSGVVRWFIRQNDALVWGNSREELVELYGDKEYQPKSLTFIPSKLSDNKILMEKDPSYLANLMAQNRVERQRLLDGNWNVRASAGQYFQKSDFPMIDIAPEGAMCSIRYWDRASTKPHEGNKDPDWTVGLLLHKYAIGRWVVADVVRFRESPLEVERRVKNTATQDGIRVTQVVEQEPGASGQAEVDNYIRLLAGFVVKARKVTKDKVTRAKPVSAQAQAGNISVVRAKWNKDFFDELENFSDDLTGHDDQVDTLSGAFNETQSSFSLFDTM